MTIRESEKWFNRMGIMALRDVEARLRRRNQELIAKGDRGVRRYEVDLKDRKYWEPLQKQIRNMSHRLIWGGMREVIFSLQKNPKYKNIVEDLPTGLQIIYKLDPEDPKFREKSNEIARQNQLRMTFDRDAILNSGESNEEGGGHENQ